MSKLCQELFGLRGVSLLKKNLVFSDFQSRPSADKWRAVLLYLYSMVLFVILQSPSAYDL